MFSLPTILLSVPHSRGHARKHPPRPRSRCRAHVQLRHEPANQLSGGRRNSRSELRRPEMRPPSLSFPSNGFMPLKRLIMGTTQLTSAAPTTVTTGFPEGTVPAGTSSLATATRPGSNTAMSAKRVAARLLTPAFRTSIGHLPACPSLIDLIFRFSIFHFQFVPGILLPAWAL